MKKLKITYKGGGTVSVDLNNDDYTVNMFVKWLEGAGTYGIWEFTKDCYLSANMGDIAAIQIENERKTLNE